VAATSLGHEDKKPDKVATCLLGGLTSKERVAAGLLRLLQVDMKVLVVFWRPRGQLC
jgi:hypothetical protein